MSDNSTVKMDDKVFVYKFRLALKEILKSTGHLGRLAVARGHKTKGNGCDVINNVFDDYKNLLKMYRHLQISLKELAFIRSAAKEIDKIESKIATEKGKSCSLALDVLRNKIVGKYDHIEVVAENSYEKCGATFVNDKLTKVTVPTMYAKNRNKIPSLSENKFVVTAVEHQHPRYKCWKMLYITYNRSKGQRKAHRTEKCYTMRDEQSNITYYHSDYKLCEAGMRRALGRGVAKRIGGA